MSYDYELWVKRAKRYDITPLWAAFATVILAPLGYWLNGDGFRGLRYTIVIFFVGYVTLGVGTFIGAAILTYDVYRVSVRHEKRFVGEGRKIEHSKYSWIFKGAMAAFLSIFAVLMFILAAFVSGR